MNNLGTITAAEGFSWADLLGGLGEVLKIDLSYDYDKGEGMETDRAFPGPDIAIGKCINPNTLNFYDYDIVILGAKYIEYSGNEDVYDEEFNIQHVTGDSVGLQYALFAFNEADNTTLLVKGTDPIDSNLQYRWLPVCTVYAPYTGEE